MEKNIDEAWKEAVEKEKERLREEECFIPPQPNFKFFITTLALQASIFLGVLEDPNTHKKESNMPQAKFIIDTLDMLKQKTQGNLTKEETDLLDNILYELRMQYISKVQGGQNK